MGLHFAAYHSSDVYIQSHWWLSNSILLILFNFVDGKNDFFGNVVEFHHDNDDLIEATYLWYFNVTINYNGN